MPHRTLSPVSRPSPYRNSLYRGHEPACPWSLRTTAGRVSSARQGIPSDAAARFEAIDSVDQFWSGNWSGDGLSTGMHWPGRNEGGCPARSEISLGRVGAEGLPFWAIVSGSACWTATSRGRLSSEGCSDGAQAGDDDRIVAHGGAGERDDASMHSRGQGQRCDSRLSVDDGGG
jgi:hypothetical protein